MGVCVTPAEVTAVLSAEGWPEDQVVVREEDQVVFLSLGRRMRQMSGDIGCVWRQGAARSLARALASHGMSLERDDKATESDLRQHLTDGHEAVVTRVAYTSQEVARAMFGAGATRAQVRAARQWLWRRMEPVDSSTKPLLWPAAAVRTALAEREAMHRTGRRHPGNRTFGAQRRGGRPARRAAGASNG